LLYFIAKFCNVLKVPSMVVISGATTTQQRTVQGVRKRKYEQKPKPARRLRIPFDEVFPDLKKLPWRRRMSVQRILLGLETVPVAEELRPPSAADIAKARKVIDEALAGGRGRALPQQTKQQRLLIARVDELRAKGEKKVVEKACTEFRVSRRTAYAWLKSRRLCKKCKKCCTDCTK
jgi:hypothetical protein